MATHRHSRVLTTGNPAIRVATAALLLLTLAVFGCSGTTADQHSSDADALWGQGRFEEAVDKYSEAISLNPRLAVAYSGRAAAYNALSQHQLAIEDADQAISVEPWAALGYNHKGLAFLNMGRFRQSQEMLDQAIGLDPNLPDAYNNRGLLSLRTNWWGKAIVDLDEAIRLDPRFGSAYANRARAHTLADQDELAQWDLERAVEFGIDLASLEAEVNDLKQVR